MRLDFLFLGTICSLFYLERPEISEILSKFAVMKTSFVATIGCFDGVHRGHQHLIRKVLQEASRRNEGSAVFTFDRQPRELFDPSFRPQLLTTLSEKERILKDMGVSEVIVLPFTEQLAGLSAEAFMRQVLKGRWNTDVLVTGYDHRFGHNREEGFEDYVRYGRAIGVEVLRGDAACFDDNGQAISSSAIRQLLAEGRVELMKDCLTRYYALGGRVVAGEHIGRELGFPTANLDPDEERKLIPASGVYAVWATVEGVRMPAMMNIGRRPTFDGRGQTLEVNILREGVGNVYGRRLTVEFVARLRSERRFESREALVQQLGADRRMALEALRFAE